MSFSTTLTIVRIFFSQTQLVKAFRDCVDFLCTLYNAHMYTQLFPIALILFCTCNKIKCDTQMLKSQKFIHSEQKLTKNL